MCPFVVRLTISNFDIENNAETEQILFCEVPIPPDFIYQFDEFKTNNYASVNGQFVLIVIIKSHC